MQSLSLSVLARAFGLKCVFLSLPVTHLNLPSLSLLFQINLGIYIKDESTELSVLVDRAVGGSSLVDGQIELMLHRFPCCL